MFFSIFQLYEWTHHSFWPAKIQEYIQISKIVRHLLLCPCEIITLRGRAGTGYAAVCPFAWAAATGIICRRFL